MRRSPGSSLKSSRGVKWCWKSTINRFSPGARGQTAQFERKARGKYCSCLSHAARTLLSSNIPSNVPKGAGKHGGAAPDDRTHRWMRNKLDAQRLGRTASVLARRTRRQPVAAVYGGAVER